MNTEKTRREAGAAMRAFYLTIPEEQRESYSRGTPYSRYRRALSAGAITQSQFDAMEQSFGDLWHYTGD